VRIWPVESGGKKTLTSKVLNEGGETGWWEWRGTRFSLGGGRKREHRAQDPIMPLLN